MKLEETLLELARFGKPTLGIYSVTGKGWHCSLNVFVTGEGTSFEVRSKFDHDTPSEAADVCLARLNKVLDDLAPKKALAGELR